MPAKTQPQSSRTRKPGIGQAFGATAGLVTITALKGSELIEQSFDVAGKSLSIVEGATDIAVDAVQMARAGFKLTGDSWLENLQIENKVDRAYAQVELVKAEMEVDELLAHAQSLKDSRAAKTAKNAKAAAK